jgi:hypothetical protein
MIKFNRYHVTDGKIKVNCTYFITEINRHPCVCIYAERGDDDLDKIFGGEVLSKSELGSTCWERDQVYIHRGNHLYAAALQRAITNDGYELKEFTRGALK